MCAATYLKAMLTNDYTNPLLLTLQTTLFHEGSPHDIIAVSSATSSVHSTGWLLPSTPPLDL